MREKTPVEFGRVRNGYAEFSSWESTHAVQDEGSVINAGMLFCVTNGASRTSPTTAQE